MMKTIMIFPVLLVLSFSCDTNRKTESDAQRERTKGEIKEAVNTIFKGCEEVDFEMAMKPWRDSPDFIYIDNGFALNYKDVAESQQSLFKALLNQKVTITGERFVFIDNSTVIYSVNCKFLKNYRDGHSTLADPMVMQITFRKINDKWMAINGVESSVKQNIRNAETSKKLNQVELNRQFLGTWKCDINRDTILFWELKAFGTGIDSYFKYVTKGQIVSEGKMLAGYDEKTDKFLWSEVIKGKDMAIYAIGFTSDNKYEGLLYNDVSNPRKASVKWQGEIKSPDMFIETMILNDKPVKTDIYIRIK